MRTLIRPDSVSVWLSSRDTFAWAMRPGHRWPCSQLRDRRLFATFDRDGLVDMSVDGGDGEQDIDGNEFGACVSDHLRTKLPSDHPLRTVVITHEEG